MLNLGGDFINNASVNQQNDPRTRASSLEDENFLNQIGEEILTVLQGSGRKGSGQAEDLNLSDFLASQVWTNPSNQFNPIGEQVDVQPISDSGYWEAFGDWYA